MVSFNTIVRECMRRVNGIAGAQISDVENTYNTVPLTTIAADNPRYNLSFIKDVVADVHGRIALAIATTADPVTGIGCHPWRSFFADVTGAVPNSTLLPKQSAGSLGKDIIGALGRPYDSVTMNLIYTPASAERISQYHQFSSTLYTVNPLLYHINGSRVYHTSSTGIIFECCSYSRTDIVSLISTNGNIRLPDVLTDTLVAGSVAASLIDSEYFEQSAFYRDLFLAALNEIGNLSVAMPGLPLLAKGSQS